MMKFTSLALVSALLIATPALADSSPSGVSSDVGAVQKDNAATAHDNAELAKDRAAKAKDKATGNWAGQAVDSTAIGADQTMKSEKGAETSTDKKILNSDTSSATSK